MVTLEPQGAEPQRAREGDGTSYPEDNRSSWFLVSILACGSSSLTVVLKGDEALA
jgi:hypothetical protein